MTQHEWTNGLDNKREEANDTELYFLCDVQDGEFAISFVWMPSLC